MLKIGFTGTRNGMSDVQLEEFKKLFDSKDFEEFHHGMCVGSDKQAHDFVTTIKEDKKVKIVGHPPKYKKFMADCQCDIIKKSFDLFNSIFCKSEINLRIFSQFNFPEILNGLIVAYL